MGGAGVTVFFVIFSCSQVLFSKRLLSCKCVLPLSLTRESRLFIGAFFFLFVSVGISRLPALPAHSLRYAREQENSGNSSLCCFLGPGVPSPSAFFSLPFNHHTLVLYVLYLYFEDEVHQLHLPRSWGSHSSLFLKGKENFVYKMIILKV